MNILNNSLTWVRNWMGTGSGLWALCNTSLSISSAMDAYHGNPFPVSLTYLCIAAPFLSNLAYNSNQALSKRDAAAAAKQKNITVLSSLATAGFITTDLVRNPWKGLLSLAIKTSCILGSIFGVRSTFNRTKENAQAIVDEANKEATDAYIKYKEILQENDHNIELLLQKRNEISHSLSGKDKATESQLSALAGIIEKIESYRVEISTKINPAIDNERGIIKNSRIKIGTTWDPKDKGQIDRLVRLDTEIDESGRKLSQVLMIELQQIADSLKQEQTRLQSNTQNVTIE